MTVRQYAQDHLTAKHLEAALGVSKRQVKQVSCNRGKNPSRDVAMPEAFEVGFSDCKQTRSNRRRRPLFDGLAQL